LLSAPGTPEAFYRQVLLPYKLAGYLEYQRRRSFASDIGVIRRTLAAVLVPAAAPPLRSTLSVPRLRRRRPRRPNPDHQ